MDLTDNDLLSIRLNASERAKILLAIQQLRLKFSKDNDESSSSSNNTSGSGSTAPQAGMMSFTREINDVSIAWQLLILFLFYFVPPRVIHALLTSS